MEVRPTSRRGQRWSLALAVGIELPDHRLEAFLAQPLLAAADLHPHVHHLLPRLEDEVLDVEEEHPEGQPEPPAPRPERVLPGVARAPQRRAPAGAVSQARRDDIPDVP